MACGGASVLEGQGGDYDPSAWERAKGGEGVLRVYVEGGRGAGGGRRLISRSWCMILRALSSRQLRRGNAIFLAA